MASWALFSFQKFLKFSVTSNLAAHAAWYFKPIYSMIEQCLLNKNESATVSNPKNFLRTEQHLRLLL